MSQEPKVFLFIDGTNVYSSQLDLFKFKKYLDFAKLIETIETKLKIKFDQIFFYASYSPRINKKLNNIYINEALFYKNVKQIKNLTFFKGYRSPTSGKEKEVDVKLTVDLVKNCILKQCGNVYLMTGDADFLQALFAIKNYQNKINLICLPNKVMHKGAYYFQTNIINFTDINCHYKPIKGQKIPQVQALRVSCSNYTKP